MVSRDDDPRAWIAAYFTLVTSPRDSPVLVEWTDAHTGRITSGPAVLGSVRFTDGGTDSTQGPGQPMQVSLDVLKSTFTYALAVDDDLAALDWALRDLRGKTDLSSDVLLASLRTGQVKCHDHSRLWRGNGLFPLLQYLAWNLTSLPGNALSLWIDPPYTVRLSHGENHLCINTSEHDTVIVTYTGLSTSFEWPVWMQGLDSWVDDFFRRLRTEDLWRVRTRFLGIPVRQDFLFDQELSSVVSRGIITRSAQLFLPAPLKLHTT